MKKRTKRLIFVWILLLIAIIFFSCSQKTCRAYAKNEKYEQNT